jgi:hypothetical protein
MSAALFNTMAGVADLHDDVTSVASAKRKGNNLRLYRRDRRQHTDQQGQGQKTTQKNRHLRHELSRIKK